MKQNEVSCYNVFGATETIGLTCCRSSISEFQCETGYEMVDGIEGYIILDEPEDDFGELVVCMEVHAYSCDITRLFNSGLEHPCSV